MHEVPTDVFATVSSLLIPCAKGAQGYLSQELRSLGFPIASERDTGVETRGTVTDAMRLNLVLRTGNRVLYELKRFRAHTPEVMYRQVTSIPWEAYIPSNGYLTVDSFVRTPGVRDGRFANVKCKDAIVDRIRTACGQRPNSGNMRAGVVVFLFWHETYCKVYLDTSGESLSRRGYRKMPMNAPMMETLAAAVILATEWDPVTTFVNPMCGSGTLAIEAALLATGRAPGLLRSDFGFLHLRGLDATAWQGLRRQLKMAPKRVGGRIIATDIRADAVAAARQNARTAGVDGLIEFSVCDFAETPVPEGGGGVVILNPEYGERMGDDQELVATYGRIGDFFKQRCNGYTGYVFTGNRELGKRIGLRSNRKIPFFNSQIECRLMAFPLYEGTKRTRSGSDDAAAAATD